MLAGPHADNDCPLVSMMVNGATAAAANGMSANHSSV